MVCSGTGGGLTLLKIESTHNRFAIIASALFVEAPLYLLRAHIFTQPPSNIMDLYDFY